MPIVAKNKKIVMARDHVPTPGNTSKEHNQTGTPNKMQPENKPVNDDITERYTADDQDVADHVRTNNPNRNTDKDTQGH